MGMERKLTSQSEPPFEVEQVSLAEAAAALRHTRVFAQTDVTEVLPGVEHLDRVKVQARTPLLLPGERCEFYWVILEGEIRADRPEPDGTWTMVGCVKAGEGLGEFPLLTGRYRTPLQVSAEQDSTLIRFGEQRVLDAAGLLPGGARGDSGRYGNPPAGAPGGGVHREKLVSLGTLAAGLMHELHNPGRRAKRAAAQLRKTCCGCSSSACATFASPTPDQVDCMRQLLEQTLASCHQPAMSTMEQADAEEAMAEWLSDAGVENAFTLAPSLVSAGLNQQELACAREAFPAGSFSHALNWLEALIANVSLVCTVEESVGRISDLVMAVKKFAYDDRSGGREVDVHESLQSTLTILGHKMRVKNLAVEKRFHAATSKIVLRGAALSQVWTNLIDNAIDASPTGGKIEIATANEPGILTVSIEDHGSGIAAEILPRIFEPFFTTKPEGSGTGLGLEIVHRIVTQNFGGTVEVKSMPGSTRFTVRLPVHEAPK